MPRGDLAENDVLMLGMLGIILVVFALMPLSLTNFVDIQGRTYVLVGGIAVILWAGALEYKRRTRHMTQYEMLRYLYENGPTKKSTLQLHAKIKTEDFERYVSQLIDRGFLRIDVDGRISITDDSIRILKDEVFARFLERESEAD